MDTAATLSHVIARGRRVTLLLTLSLLICPLAPNAAEIYKSVDADGRVTYSDHPTTPAATVIAGPSYDDGDLVEMTAATAPPELLNREQPPCPDDGDIWTPGYWSWDGATYFWQPGVWVFPPQVGVFWTPGYWAYTGTEFVFRRGYWSSHVGYYGGINYGFGYWGNGYEGGHWEGREFAYNRALNNVNPHAFRHVYEESVHDPGVVSRVSYNGGPGGTSARPSAQERLAERSRLPPQPQREHLQVAPSPGPSMASLPNHYEPPRRATASRTSVEPFPGRPAVSGNGRQRAPVNPVTRPAPAVAKPPTSRPRTTPSIRELPLK